MVIFRSSFSHPQYILLLWLACFVWNTLDLESIESCCLFLPIDLFLSAPQDIFRKYPNKYESIISTLCENLDSLDEPEARLVQTVDFFRKQQNPEVKVYNKYSAISWVF